jgi:hypothetical protein
VARALRDELAEVQGKRPNPPRDDQEQESGLPETPGAAKQSGALDLVDSWDDTGPYPRTKDHATTTLTALGLSIARRAVPVIGVAIVVAIIALAIIWSLPAWWRDFGKDTPIILLLAFTGLAVFTWCLAQVVSAVRRPSAVASVKRRWVRALRRILATAILIPTAGTAYLEWSAYAQSSRAMYAVNARHGKWVDSAPPTRQEVEALIGRTADHPPLGDIGSRIEVTYRWTGVFRTYVLRAKYMRLRYDVRDPQAKPPEGEEGFDVLYWISDVLE